MFHPNVDGTLLPAVMDQIFVDNRDRLFYTPPALDAAVNVNSFA